MHKSTTVEDNKKRMNLANFINIYTNIHIPKLYVTKITQNENNSISSML